MCIIHLKPFWWNNHTWFLSKCIDSIPRSKSSRRGLPHLSLFSSSFKHFFANVTNFSAASEFMSNVILNFSLLTLLWNAGSVKKTPHLIFPYQTHKIVLFSYSPAFLTLSFLSFTTESWFVSNSPQLLVWKEFVLSIMLKKQVNCYTLAKKTSSTMFHLLRKSATSLRTAIVGRLASCPGQPLSSAAGQSSLSCFSARQQVCVYSAASLLAKKGNNTKGQVTNATELSN